MSGKFGEGKKSRTTNTTAVDTGADTHAELDILEKEREREGRDGAESAVWWKRDFGRTVISERLKRWQAACFALVALDTATTVEV